MLHPQNLKFTNIFTNSNHYIDSCGGLCYKSGGFLEVSLLPFCLMFFLFLVWQIKHDDNDDDDDGDDDDDSSVLILKYHVT